METRWLILVLAATTVCQGTEARNRTVYVSRGGDPWAAAAVLQYDQSASRRPRRGVINLYNMVQCSTGCDPLLYKGYGCYCGFLGSGYPVDPIDRCCKMHDWCYNTANCPMYLEYFIPYYWQCFHRRPFCAIEHGFGGICAQRLCECDRMLSECLRRFPCPRHKAVCTSSTWRYLQNILMQ